MTPHMHWLQAAANISQGQRDLQLALQASWAMLNTHLDEFSYMCALFYCV